MNRRSTRSAARHAFPFGLMLATLFWTAVTASQAMAATVEFTLVVNPTAINGCVGCTLSGPGTWDLLASTSAGDNFGIASYKVALLNVTSILHRSPRTNLSTDPEGSDPEPARSGFTLLRSGNNVNPIVASQDTVGPTPYIIRGFGQTASSFAAQYPGTFSSGVSNQQTAAGWAASVLLAEGTFSPGGPWPALNLADPSAANVFIEATGAATQAALAVCAFSCLLNDVSTNITDFTDTADLNEIITHTMIAPNNPAIWGASLLNPTYTPMFGAVLGVTGLAKLPTWNPTTQAFRWDTSGSSRGRYTWEVTATNRNGSDTGLITVDVPFVPEPSTLSTFGVAILGCVGMIRRVRGSNS